MYDRSQSNSTEIANIQEDDDFLLSNYKRNRNLKFSQSFNFEDLSKLRLNIVFHLFYFVLLGIEDNFKRTSNLEKSFNEYDEKFSSLLKTLNDYLKHLREEIDNSQKDNIHSNHNMNMNKSNQDNDNLIYNDNIYDIESNYDVISNILSVFTEISHITIETSKSV